MNEYEEFYGLQVLDICYSKELSQYGALVLPSARRTVPFHRDRSVYLSTLTWS